MSNGSSCTNLMKGWFVDVVHIYRLTVLYRQLDEVNSPNSVESCFTAFARELRLAPGSDPRRAGAVPSSKGVLERAGA